MQARGEAAAESPAKSDALWVKLPLRPGAYLAGAPPVAEERERERETTGAYLAGAPGVSEDQWVQGNPGIIL